MLLIRCVLLVLLTSVGAFAANPPATVTASPSCSSVAVNWTAASGSGGNAPAQYEIFRDSANTLIGTVAATVLTFSDTGAGTSAHTYGVRTRASNGSLSTTTWSSSVAATCPPGAPGNLAATTPSCSQVSLSWSAPSQTGAGLVGYRIYRNNVYITQVSVLTYANSGLAASTSYTYDVSAMDSAGRESAKTRVVATTPSCQAQTPVAGPPGAARLCMEGMNGVVTWPGYTGVRYQVECSTDFGVSWSPVGVPTTSFGVTNVRVGPAVVYRVAWFTNTAEYRNNYSLFSSDVTPPTASSTVTATELSGARIRLDWSPSSDAQSGLKGYLLYRDDSFLAYAPNGVTTYTDTTGQAVGGAYDLVTLDRAGNASANVKPNCTFNPPSGSFASAQSVVISAPTAGASIRYTTDGSTPSSSFGTLYSSPVYLPASTTLKAVAYKGNKTVSAVTTGSYTIAPTCVSPSITTHPASQSVTAGASVSFSAAASGTATLSYQWRKNGVNVSGATSPTYSLSSVSTSDAGNYSVVVNNACGSAASASATLTVNAACVAPAITTHPVSQSVTAGASVSFSAAASGTSPLSYQWRKNGVNVTGANSSTYSLSNVSTSDAGDYSVVVNNACGSATSAAATLTVNTPCSYTLSPGSSSFGNAGGTGSFIVYTGTTCSRTATPSGWITITSGGTGSGNGTVAFSVAANTGAARTGTITISGSGPSQTYTVYQDAAAACTYSLTPTNVYFSSAVANGSSIISAGSGCGWSVSETNAWVTITSPLSGSGGASLTYSLASNPSLVSGRVGKIYFTAGGQTKTINITQDPNYAPVANAGANSSATVGVAATLNGSGSTDEDGYIASYQWNFGDGTTGNGITTSHTYNAAGSYTVTLTTTDDLGASASANKTVTVSPPADTTAPTASLTAPSGGATLSGTATFSANASDNVGVARVEFWCDGSMLLGTDTSTPFSITYNTAGIPNGTRTFTCKAFDAAGNATTSGVVSATVNNSTSSGGQLAWVKPMSCVSGNAYVTGVAVDRSGNVVASGAFNGTVDLGSGAILSLGGGAMVDGLVARYSAQGALLWVKHLGGVGHDYVQAIAVDSQDNIIVAGRFQGIVDFGGGPLNTGSSYTDNLFVVKYSPSGAHLWSKRFGGTGSVTIEQGSTVAIDGSGNVIVAAKFVGTADFGGVSLTSAGVQDVALAKLSGATGATVWAKRFGGTDTDVARAVAVDRFGDVIVTGYFFGNVNLGGGSLSAAGGANDVDLFLAKYAGTDGSYRWGKRIGGSVGSDNAAGLATDPNTGNIFVSGHFAGVVDFGGSTPLDSYNNGGIFFVGYGPSGNYLWGKATGGGSDNGLAVTMDQSGNLVLSGKAASSIYFGGDRMLLGSGQPSLFVASFRVDSSLPNAEPAYRWAKYMDAGNSGGNAVALDASGQVVAGGSFMGTVDFGGTSITAPVGWGAGFVGKYTQ